MDENRAQKTRRSAGSCRYSKCSRATAYPARMSGCGRRAREVMPAAIQALVTMCEREDEAAAGMRCKLESGR